MKTELNLKIAKRFLALFQSPAWMLLLCLTGALACKFEIADNGLITVETLTATPQSVSTLENTALPITLSGVDSVSTAALTYKVTSEPASGTLSGTAPNLVYTPNAEFVGTDSFNFEVYNGSMYSVAASVAISVGHVNYKPTAQGQSLTTTVGSPLSITLSATDLNTTDTLTYTVISHPTHGTLSGTAPHLTYTPGGAFGPDSFTFEATDGTQTSTIATISIEVNGPPIVISGLDDAYTGGGTGFNVSGGSGYYSVSVGNLWVSNGNIMPEAGDPFGNFNGANNAINDFTSSDSGFFMANTLGVDCDYGMPNGNVIQTDYIVVYDLYTPQSNFAKFNIIANESDGSTSNNNNNCSGNGNNNNESGNNNNNESGNNNNNS